MRTHFYNRTMYPFIQREVPDCFQSIDQKFDKIHSNYAQALSDEYLILSTNLCRRMGDIDLYAQFVEESLEDEDPYRGAQIIGSYLVGYFSACKSLMDAGSIIINNVFELGLPKKQQDFDPKRGGFWGKFNRTDESAFNRYHKFQSFFSEIIKWRNFAVHRANPIVMVHGTSPPDQAKREEISIKMIANPDVQQDKLVSEPNEIDWMEPLDQHEEWRPQMIDLCNNLGKDIETKLDSYQAT